MPFSMTKKTIPVSTFQFLKDLKKNNDRDWFARNKDRYLSEYESMIGFADAFLCEMQKIDHLETESGKKSLHRIYRDTRFSKDKTPYKSNFSGGFRRATRLLRGGYYYHIEPGNSFAAGGFFNPNKEDLHRIREDIDQNHEEWRALFRDKKIKATFGNLKGETLKIMPRGFPVDHPAVDLLRHKQFLLIRTFTDKEVLSPSFLPELVKTYKNIRPFFDYMSQVLTTDSNGEPLF